MNQLELSSSTTPSGIEYLSCNTNGTRLLVFIHGWRDSASGWRWVIDDLNIDPSWKLIAVQRRAVEQRGTGAAALLDEYASQVIDVISDASGPRSEIVLVGQSMGAAVAELAAARLADRLSGLLLITPAPLGGTNVTPDVRLAYEASARDLSRVNTGLSRVILAVNRSAEAQLRMILATPDETEHSTLQTLSSWIDGHPAGHQPSSVAVPTRIV
ncbi:alpha/beta fold hydrolase [Paraburkholderia sp. EG286B]|uniref:alpha/beta fold hydrolase n=1 Tax=Paraburkholderia sp. EG286B TaxID=3237011 RepID=UPI0034D269D1